MTGALESMAINCSEGIGKEDGGGRDVTLCVKKLIDCTELSLKNGNEQVES